MTQENQKPQIDLHNRKILYQLDLNARQSFTQIAKRVNLSKEVVNYRIKRMTDEGIIKGFFTILNTSKLDLLTFRIFLKLHANFKEEQEIIEYLIKQSKVGWIVRIKGNWDLNLAVWIKDIYEFNEFWNEFLSVYKKYISKNWISIITKMYHFNRVYLLNKKINETTPILMGEKTKKVDFDETDLKILKILAPNSRISVIEMSDKLKINEKVIRYRIKRMIKEKIILGFRVLLDLEKLGYEYYKIHLTLQDVNKERIKKLFDYINENPNIVYHTETIGGADIEIEFQIENNKMLYEQIELLRKKFVDLIVDYEVLQYEKEYKMNYLPE